jgi:hypothetical protein
LFHLQIHRGESFDAVYVLGIEFEDGLLLLDGLLSQAVVIIGFARVLKYDFARPSLTVQHADSGCPEPTVPSVDS